MKCKNNKENYNKWKRVCNILKMKLLVIFNNQKLKIIANYTKTSNNKIKKNDLILCIFMIKKINKIKNLPFKIRTIHVQIT
jgi:hypothetical protein